MQIALCIRSAVVLAAGIVAFVLGLSQAAMADVDCGQPTGVTCIEIGRTAAIKVTSQLLGMDCVDNQGHPRAELITLSVTGAPTTGGATATFTPAKIQSYSGSSRLEIDTHVHTKAAGYTINIKGTGEHCGKYPGYQWFVWVVPIIGVDDNPWWFNGPQPEGYPDRVTVVAAPYDRPPYHWYIREGSRNYLSFTNGSNDIVTNEGEVVVIGKQPTDPSVTVGVEVTSELSPLSRLEEVRVRKPSRLVELSQEDHSNRNTGYYSETRYSMKDQYGDTIREDKLPINIVFLPQHEFFPGNNWIRPPRPHYFVSPEALRILVYPVTEVGKPIDMGVPRPEKPHGGMTKVDCWKGTVFAGSETRSAGVKLETLTWLRYRDHATSGHIYCPP